MHWKGFFLIVAVTVGWWPSCRCQIMEKSTDEVILDMLRTTIDKLNDQKATLSTLEDQNQRLWDKINEQDVKWSELKEQIKKLSDSEEEQTELLPSLKKFSTIHNFIINHNECLDGSHRCSESAQCIDTAFSYNCLCKEGFTGDGFRCIDIDECQENTYTCHPEAECRNTIGSYSCTCKIPYDGDGHTCEPSCRGSLAGATFIKGLGCLKKVDIEMSWEDSQRYCLSQGMRLAEDFSNKEEILTVWNAVDTDGKSFWVGAKARRWETTGKELKQEIYWDGQPDGRGSDCIYLTGRGLGDAGCHDTRYFLCQKVFFP